ncbi:hypothetical protein MMC17_007934 [Xylographa soralifera]|nr:hypothetical protein [Xylographa soralifera]
MDLSMISALTPPPGTTSNFINPTSLATTTIVCSAIFLALATAFVLVRLYANLRITNSIGWDDGAATLALLGSVSYCGIILSTLYYTRHEWDIPITAFTASYLQKIYVDTIVGGFTLFFAKLSLFLLLLRLFAPNHRLRYQAYFGIAVSACLFLATIIVPSALCVPRKGQNWDDLSIILKCSEERYFAVVQGVINVALDFFLLYIPIPVVWTLQLQPKKKIGVIAIFTTGFMYVYPREDVAWRREPDLPLPRACIASLLGMIYKILLLTDSDELWITAKVDILNVVEENVAIICSSMPALASFLRSKTSKSEGRPSTNASHGSESQFKLISTLRSIFSRDSIDTDDSAMLTEEKGYDELGGSQRSRTVNTIRGGDLENQPTPTRTAVESGGIVKSVGLEFSYGRDF